MKIIITKDYEEMSERAFLLMKETVTTKPDAVLGLATGSTPLGLYSRMAEDHRGKGTSYRNIRTVNLDEYEGLDGRSEHSYITFMRENLFRHLDIAPENTHIPNGTAQDAQAECARYNALLGVLRQDIQLLGIGSNGHIAFNEPGTPFDSVTHLVTLSESTVKDNSRLFRSMEEVPRRAYTMGLSNIMNARSILLLANGENKARAVRGLVEGEITPSLPASILRLHKNCTLVCDKGAASLLRENDAENI